MGRSVPLRSAAARFIFVLDRCHISVSRRRARNVPTVPVLDSVRPLPVGALLFANRSVAPTPFPVNAKATR